MKISKQQQSVIAIAAGFFLIAWIKHSYIFLIAGCLAGLTLPFPPLHDPIHTLWMFISRILGWVSSHIILSILFYLFLTPVALLRKLMGSGGLKVTLKNDTTVFYQRNHIYTSNDFVNPW